MKSLHTILDQAEERWRDVVEREFPLWGSTKVVREEKPDEKMQDGHDWMFATDLSKIYALIKGDENLQKKFKGIVAKLWGGDPDELAEQVLHYLLDHELYHPIEAPFSVKGEGNDRSLTVQAMKRGIQKAVPGISPKSLVARICAAQNLVEDFLDDNRVYMDNRQRHSYRDDIIPVFDLIEIESKEAKTNAYSISRFIYGVLYGPQSVDSYFRKFTKDEGATAAEKALTELLGENVTLPKPGKKRDPNREAYLLGLAEKIRGIFAGEDRYNGIERLMGVLGAFVEEGKPAQGRGNGNYAQGNPQDILQDIMNDMNPEEKNDFLSDLSKDKKEIKGMESLDVIAAHEYYKANHPKIELVSGAIKGEIEVVGKRRNLKVKRTSVITREQVARLNMDSIMRFQQRARRPMLIPIQNGLYTLSEYAIVEHEVRDIVYSDSKIDVPEIVEFYIDGSGSMHNSNGLSLRGFSVNDGSRYDMLCCVLYGLMDALQQASKKIGKTCKVKINKFAVETISSEFVDAVKYWEGDKDALKVVFGANDGGNTYLNIHDENRGGRRVYMIVSDGQVTDARGQASVMRQLAADAKTSVALFEIGGTYELGTIVRGDSKIKYHQVHDKEEMLKNGLKVLLEK